ncbi:uncharacterized protein LOC112081432 [Eutrema salsugineum]|uniref:uncharacterized protein LOC112081432 n=1 Tax=Eutrema salsugineum TaxID=72664 RepID=UPI000CED70D5|nr:uncharacterized protein LOC112081432 [Eutrema salsugineum]
MWEALKDKFGATSATKLRRLNQKFNDYKKRPNQSMRQHLRVMSNMIRELKNAGQIMSNEQQVQPVLHSLPESWDHMKASKSFNKANFASSNSGMKRKKGNMVHKAPYQSELKRPKKNVKRGKHVGKKDKTKMKCYTVAHWVTLLVNALRQRSYAMLTESHPSWIVDSGATDHVARSREAFVEYRRRPKGSVFFGSGYACDDFIVLDCTTNVSTRNLVTLESTRARKALILTHVNHVWLEKQ